MNVRYDLGNTPDEDEMTFEGDVPTFRLLFEDTKITFVL